MFQAYRVVSSEAAFLQYEAAGGRTELSGGELGARKLLVLGVEQAGGEPQALSREAVAVVSAVEHGLEVHGLSRIEGAAVGEQQAVQPVVGRPGFAVFRFRGAEAAEAQFAGKTRASSRKAEFRLDCPAPFPLGEAGAEIRRQAGESVYVEARQLCYGLSVLVAQGQAAPSERLAAEVVGRVDRRPSAVVSERQRDAVFFVGDGRFGLPGSQMYAVAAVGESGQLHLEGVGCIEAAGGVVEAALEDFFFPFEYAHAHRAEVPQSDCQPVVGGARADVLRMQPFVHVGAPSGADSRDQGFVAGEFPGLSGDGVAVGEQAQVVVAAGIPSAEF